MPFDGTWPRDDGWARCVDHRAAIERWLGGGSAPHEDSKTTRQAGVDVADPTLHRFAVVELHFGRTATTTTISLDGEPVARAAA